MKAYTNYLQTKGARTTVPVGGMCISLAARRKPSGSKILEALLRPSLALFASDSPPDQSEIYSSSFGQRILGDPRQFLRPLSLGVQRRLHKKRAHSTAKKKTCGTVGNGVGLFHSSSLFPGSFAMRVARWRRQLGN